MIGGSGSGKTTLTRVLLGLEHAETGEITYFGKPVQGEVAGELRRSCGLVFQSPFGSLDPRWRVGRSVAEPLRLHHPDWSQGRIAERVSEAFRMVSLDPAAYENRFPWTSLAVRRNAWPSHVPLRIIRKYCLPTSR